MKKMLSLQSQNTTGMDVNDYNNEPVWYCRDCLSLTVLSFGGHDYCRDCGGSDIGCTDINGWEKMYRARHGHDFIDKKRLKTASTKQ